MLLPGANLPFRRRFIRPCSTHHWAALAADPDTAKAAQWCVEQGLMKRRLNGKFAPGSSIPAYQVLNAYRKLAGG